MEKSQTSSISPELLMANGRPRATGLYNPENERDACGVGFVADMTGIQTRDAVLNAITMLERMDHRGACGCERNTGDGAGILLGIPREFMAKLMTDLEITPLPAAGEYAVGMLFLPAKDDEAQKKGKKIVQETAAVFEVATRGWRVVPTSNTTIGTTARLNEPTVMQVFFTAKEGKPISQKRLEQLCYVIMKISANKFAQEPELDLQSHWCSLSTRTIVYKGQLLSYQLFQYYPDLLYPDFKSNVCVVHSRFSTNTFPSWDRAQPFTCVAHNGEFNTLRGNVNWTNSRQGLLKCENLGLSEEQLKATFPVIGDNLSDSGTFNNVLQLLVASGREIPEAMMMMIPEAWQSDDNMTPDRKAFYEYSSALIEPWDGPALVAFTDGQYLGCSLDRNGLRPGRFVVTHDDLVLMSSETGTVDIKPELVKRKGRLCPGQMFLLDLEEGRIIEDFAIKSRICGKYPYQQWLTKQVLDMAVVDQEHKAAILPATGGELALANPPAEDDADLSELVPELSRFGWTLESVELLLVPMCKNGMEALGSMGNDSPLSVLARSQHTIFEYLKHLFAQVTNPPLDSTRESCVMSLETLVGPEGDLTTTTEAQCHKIRLASPILTATQHAALLNLSDKGWKAKVIDITFDKHDGGNGLVQGLARAASEAATAVDAGFKIIVLSDQLADDSRVPMSSAMAVGAVHSHLVKLWKRTRVALVIDSGEAREVHHMCVLVGYGADAVHPRMAFQVINQLQLGSNAQASFIKAVHKGMLKVMAKMGISTLHSYKGAQIFEALGLGDDVINTCFPGTASRIGGPSIVTLGNSFVRAHHEAAERLRLGSKILRNPGDYHYRSNEGSEPHLNDPTSIAKLQEAARTNSRAAYEEYSRMINDLNSKCTIRGQLEFKSDGVTRIPVEEVEPASEIVKRFCTGAMSYGSISLEAHTTLAKAMNALGGKSNTGEGGEAMHRLLPMEDGSVSTERSAIKQIASGRFGVTSLYLSNADELQIKMAQGAKPGEGGELPGHKVVGEIAKVRHSTEGVGLISPPPHHDIYSIEDLKELIFDLKNSNPDARISVKLVSEVGVGVVASGVAKGNADHILISGHDGGTGASRWTGVKNAGLPWELGLAETQQTLVMNDLRGRVIVQTDGQLKTGRDVAIACLLGAEEFGFATAPLIAMGCIMMRKCHLNTCPVGIATQDPELRKKFRGTPEHVQNFLFMIAEEMRTIMANLGIRNLVDMVGRVDLLQANPALANNTNSLNFSKILIPSSSLRPHAAIRHVRKQDDLLATVLDQQLVKICAASLSLDPVETAETVNIKNTDRAVGCLLSHHVTKIWRGDQMPHDTIHISFNGSAGQSFGCWVCHGITFQLNGDANDYFGKGLCGGRLILRPPSTSTFTASENVIVGNVALYGATSGSVFIRGMAGERFCVRNSGAKAVVEGVGDHCCEYMTGGRVVVLGHFGRNFAAGMSGGIAYVYDPDHKLNGLINPEMVEVSPLSLERDVLELRSLLQQHRRYTDSDKAAGILAHFDRECENFIRVIPTEYRKVLERKEAEADAAAAAALARSPGRPRRVISRQRKFSRNSPSPPRTETKDDIEDSLLAKVVEKRPSNVPAPSKKRGFIEYGREVVKYRRPAERIHDWDELTDTTVDKKALLKTQAARCMDCGVPFCHQKTTGCPLGNKIPEWNEYVFRGDYKRALYALLATNNFPEFTGRVCPAPCEGSCVLGIIENPVSIKQIEVSIIDRGFAEGWIVPQPPAIRSNQTVAIVGSGPAGLAAADQLNKAGHTVTVYERDDRIGGLMMYGVPNMKCDKENVVQRRVDLMEAEGVVFRPSVSVGTDITLEELRSSNDAVLLAVGSTTPRDLTIPGRDSKGIHFAMDFLRANTKSLLDSKLADKNYIDVKGKTVVVIGGGDTGNDCIGTSVRHGAASVVNLELLPKPPQARADDNPWPQWPKVFRVDYGHEEVKQIYGDDPRQFQVLSKDFISDDNGSVCGIRTVTVKWDKDETGRWKMEEVAGSERVLPAQVVLLALGFLGPEMGVVDGIAVECDRRSNFSANEDNYETTQKGLFAAGDCRRGQSLVVWAIAEGRAAAASIISYLAAAPTTAHASPQAA